MSTYTCYKCHADLDIQQGVGVYCRNGCPPRCYQCGSEAVYDNYTEAYCCPKGCQAPLTAGAVKPSMKYPGVAIGVVIQHPTNGCILLGQRKGELGGG